MQAETQKFNLLWDIQAKLQDGKSAGYTRWAKVATDRYNTLAAQIKSAEKRIAELMYRPPKVRPNQSNNSVISISK